MNNWTIFDDAFWLTMGTMLFGFLAVLVRYGFMSKCDNVSLCMGLIQIHRAVELENPIEEEEEKKDEEKI